MNSFYLSLGIMLTIPSLTLAQYPTVPDSVKVRVNMQKKINDSISNIAWERAIPTIELESKNGRPYKPWASKPEDLIRAKIPAFPGAEGGGAYTPGGRKGKILIVSNLNDSGPGSFREACETGGARIIVFNVAGIINLKSPLRLRAPYVTIAGQTAPGDGICITGASFLIDTHDVIIRYMRFRRGQTDVGFRDDALGGNCIGNIIIDHVSASWGLDENMSIYRHVYNRNPITNKGEKLPTVNITIQNSIFSEALDIYNHGFGATIGGRNCSFIRNLFASNISRNCSIGMGDEFNFINNVIFNWWNRTIDGGDNTSKINIINNYFKPGPITPKNKPIRHRIIKLETGRSEKYKNKYGKAYVNGNIIEDNSKVTENNWSGGVQGVNLDKSSPEWNNIIMQTPFEMPHVNIMNALDAYKYVIDNVGATLPVRDKVDERIIQTVITGKAIYDKNAKEIESPYVKRRLPADSYKQGIITHPSQVGGLPEYNGNPIRDSDKDGIPDKWEIKHGLNPHNPNDANEDYNGDGYTNIEKYINSIL